MWYEVDLRRRTDGESVECIYSGEDYETAYRIAEWWNKKNVPDYNGYREWESYIDDVDGMFAYVYHIDSETELHGVGMF